MPNYKVVLYINVSESNMERVKEVISGTVSDKLDDISFTSQKDEILLDTDIEMY